MKKQKYNLKELREELEGLMKGRVSDCCHSRVFMDLCMNCMEHCNPINDNHLQMS